MSDNFAPILLIGYNRPDKIRAVLSSLLQCKDLEMVKLYVSIDGPKEKRLTDKIAQNQIEDIVKSFTPHFKSIQINRNTENKGLANNIVESIQTTFNYEERLIILEDDIQVVSPYFLQFMNEALTRFENSSIYQISAYNYPISSQTFSHDIYALRVMSCWGWATWKSRWKVYSDDIQSHYSYWSKRSRKKEFDLLGNAYFFNQLERNFLGTMKSWAVLWYASWMKAGGQCIYPKTSLVQNIGMDGSGTFTSHKNIYNTGTNNSKNWDWNIVHNENGKMLAAIDMFFKNVAHKKHKQNLKRTMQRFIKRLKIKLKSYIYVAVDEYLKRSSIEKSTINQPSKIGKGSQLFDVVLGSYSYISRYATVSHCIIGKYCSIGPYTKIGWGIHPVKGFSTAPMFYSTQKQNGVSYSNIDKIQERKPVIIGNDVFIGMNVTILDGITIGDGAVIGAGAVVSKDIPSYAIAVGAPIKIIGYRFDDEIIDRMTALKWWDMDSKIHNSIEKNFFEVNKLLLELEALDLKVDSGKI
jgi:acetyltransferase-like isoleucine patch superfamily enzyme